MTKIEQVARAIAPKAWATFGKIGVDSFPNENRRKASLRHARDAVEALREPSEDMALAGFDQLDNEDSPHAAEACWQAMIDAILLEQPQSGEKGESPV